MAHKLPNTTREAVTDEAFQDGWNLAQAASMFLQMVKTKTRLHRTVQSGLGFHHCLNIHLCFHFTYINRKGTEADSKDEKTGFQFYYFHTALRQWLPWRGSREWRALVMKSQRCSKSVTSENFILIPEQSNYQGSGSERDIHYVWWLP